ncbi:TonB-dependent receptor [Sphingomonas nostoxanthinifaciens]|uniref:TonB-dependent receptor n=1 Tax=Sphingomonas nostoxanthinifaciens TaxID=2872652 RepID=UPI001CC1FBDF|nr:TonB-dependent receptor [Sphingomonas nostoxanthinifaciens]UAK23579.1 TonB-dependent receptor [Sphingomonas nostoxanthinifaciens]
MKKYLIGCAMGALAAGSAYAQTSGTADLEAKEIVVTGTSAKGIDGKITPNTTKAKAELTSEFIQHQTPGQSILDTINQLPGVSFQNNDPYGSSGGTLNIHGFDASRIGLLIDGFPLNDTGNYALYSNQQLDPELIEQISVNLGTNDIDSPTASATGSTVNYRTRIPTDKFGARLAGSTGEYGYFRVFGVVDTGEFTPFGTKAWVSASNSQYRNPFNDLAQARKTQANAMVYQPIGSNGDFIWVAGNYNENRNNNFSSLYLRSDSNRTVGSSSSNRFPNGFDEVNYTSTVRASCAPSASNSNRGGIDTPQAGVADVPNSCGTLYDQSFNPSNTATIRANSRFTLTDKLTLNIDPAYSYTKANGGTGAVKANEGFYTRAANATSGLAAITAPIYGYIGGQAYFGGKDLNGDGDILDTPGRAASGALTNTTQGVEVYSSSHTGTNRYIINTSLRYDLTETQTFRVGYTYDHGRHRQTGMIAPLQQSGATSQYFPIDNPLLDNNGLAIQKRNRLSYAVLNQGFGEYVGHFLEDKLTIDAGVTYKAFTRKLNNFCVTETGGSFVDCFTDAASQAAFLAASPGYVGPTSKTVHFNKWLPSAGLTFQFTPQISAYANYNKNVQVPGTDNLYQSLGYTADQAQPKAETTDNFVVGTRYRSSKFQADVSGWYTKFHNRLASAYDPFLDVSVYRNLGTVEKYGVDGSLAYKPIQYVTLSAFGSYLKSKIDADTQLGRCTTVTNIGPCTSTTNYVYAATAGKRESGAPVYLLGGRIEGNYGPLVVGFQGKRTGRRYINDQNLPVVQCSVAFVNSNQCTGTQSQVYGAFAKGYTVFDLDARFSMAWLGLNDKTFFQLNVTNIFDKFYVAGFSGTNNTTSVSTAYISPPRAISGTLNVAF